MVSRYQNGLRAQLSELTTRLKAQKSMLSSLRQRRDLMGDMRPPASFIDNCRANIRDLEQKIADLECKLGVPSSEGDRW